MDAIVAGAAGSLATAAGGADVVLALGAPSAAALLEGERKSSTAAPMPDRTTTTPSKIHGSALGLLARMT